MQWHRDAWAKAYVWSSAIVMVDLRLKRPPQMSLTQGNHEIQTFSTRSAHEAFAYRIRLGRPYRGSQNPDAHICHELVEFCGENAVPVVDYKAVWMVIRKCLSKLLGRPLSRRMCSDVVVKDLLPTDFDDHKDIENAEAIGNYYEEVTSDDSLGVFAHKGQPSLH